MATILVVDDEFLMTNMLNRVLVAAGFAMRVQNDPTEVAGEPEQGGIEFVLCDLKMPVKDGISVLRETRRTHPDIPFVVLTGNASIKTAIEALRQGAFD